MNFVNYAVSETETTKTLPLVCPSTLARVLRHRHKSFTLAETLITLALIGIVAALTIPTAISKIQDYSYKKAWKSIYADLSNAYSIALKDGNLDFSRSISSAPLIWSQGCHPETYYELFSHLKTVEMCVHDNGTNTIPQDRDCSKHPTKHYTSALIDVTGLNGVPQKGIGQGAMYSGTGGVAILENGAQIYAMNYMWACPFLTVDVNGLGNGPDIVGRDIFTIRIDEKRLIPGGDPQYPLTGCSKSAGATTSGSGINNFSGAGCGYKYLYE